MLSLWQTVKQSSFENKFLLLKMHFDENSIILIKWFKNARFNYKSNDFNRQNESKNAKKIKTKRKRIQNERKKIIIIKSQQLSIPSVWQTVNWSKSILNKYMLIANELSLTRASVDLIRIRIHQNIWNIQSQTNKQTFIHMKACIRESQRSSIGGFLRLPSANWRVIRSIL